MEVGGGVLCVWAGGGWGGVDGGGGVEGWSGGWVGELGVCRGVGVGALGLGL